MAKLPYIELANGLKILGLVVSVAVVGSQSIQAQPAVRVYTNYTVSLSGAFQVPARESSSLGLATVRYELQFPDIYHPTNDYLTNTIVDFLIKLPVEFTALSAGIYGPASPNSVGELLYDMGQAVVTTNIFQIISWPPATNAITNLTLDFATSMVLTPLQLKSLESGLLYASVCSTGYPEGELRGHLTVRPVLGNLHRVSQGGYAFDLSGLPPYNYLIEYSTNGSDWFGLTNFSASHWVANYTDLMASNSMCRLYRVRTLE